MMTRPLLMLAGALALAGCEKAFSFEGCPFFPHGAVSQEYIEGSTVPRCTGITYLP